MGILLIPPFYGCGSGAVSSFCGLTVVHYEFLFHLFIFIYYFIFYYYFFFSFVLFLCQTCFMVSLIFCLLFHMVSMVGNVRWVCLSLGIFYTSFIYIYFRTELVHSACGRNFISLYKEWKELIEIKLWYKIRYTALTLCIWTNRPEQTE